MSTNKEIIVRIDEDGELVRAAIEAIVEKKKASTNFLKTELNVGYERAKKILDALADVGVVEKGDGTRYRKLLITPQQARAIHIVSSGGVDTLTTPNGDDAEMNEGPGTPTAFIAKDKSLTKEDIESVAELYGAKLAYLLNVTNLSEDKKQSWLSLMPSMSLEQLERFTDILETQYADEQTKHVDESFKKELKQIDTDYNEKSEKLKKTESETLAKLKKLTQTL